MKLSPLSKHAMRVHELAKELGWPASQLIAQLRSRGEYVKSAMSTVEAPVIRAIRRDFATISDAPDPDASLASEVYGYSAEPHVGGGPNETFAAALARARSQSVPKGQGAKPAQWRVRRFSRCC
jgi:hypothetical protein